MDIKHYNALIQRAPFGIAYQRILRDESGKAIDYLFLQANAEFGRIIGLDSQNIIGKTVREVLSEAGKADSAWAQFYDQLHTDAEIKEDKEFSEPLKLWYQRQAIDGEKDQFFIYLFVSPKPLETEQKCTERELEEKHKYIESLLAAIPDLMFVFDQDGRIEDLKSGHGETLYIPKEQALQANVNDVLPKDVAKRMLQKHAEVLKTGKTGYLQYQLIIDGSLRDYEARISPLGSHQVISLARDITEQNRAITTLQQQNQFQNMITDISTAFVKASVENIDRIIYESLEQVGQYFAIHRAYIFRYSSDYRMLYNTNEWNAPELAPIQGLQKIYPSLNTPWWHRQVMAGKLILTEDKQELPPEAKAEFEIMAEYDIRSLLFVPIITGSRVLGYFGFDSIGEKHSFSESEIGNLRVIANLLAEVLQKFDFERKMQDQAHLQKLISGMALKFINLPTSGIQDSINASLADLGNFANAERAFIFEYKWDKQICRNTNEWCAPGIRSQKESFQSTPLDEMQDWVTKHRAGETVLVGDLTQLDEHDRARKIMSEQGIKSVLALPVMRGEECLGFVGFDFMRIAQTFFEMEITLLSLFAQLLVNIRTRRELEERLILEKERAEAANQAKSEFLANMSHEIRTPLNGVIGFTELMLNSSLSTSQRQYAQNIINSSKSLLAIINDILDFSKIEAGKLELDPVRTDLLKLAEHALNIIRVSSAQKNIEVLLNIPKDLPRFVIVDALRLNQILINLLSNAEKFTEAGEIELKLSFAMEDDDHAKIRFAVRDTGIGIGELHKRRLFKAFTQLDSSTTRKYGGSGLGLVISNDLANLMGSNIELSSELNKGSEFSFVLTCRVETSARAEEYPQAGLKTIDTADETEIITKPLSLPFKEPPRILIAEDNSLNLTLLKEMIYQQIPEAQIFSAEDGLEAVLKTRQLAPHIILMDVQMPNLDGVNASIEIRKFSDLPIIAITAGALDEERERCQKAEMNDFLTKPLLRNELRDTLAKYIPQSLAAAPKERDDIPLEDGKKRFNRPVLMQNLLEDTEILCSLLKTVLDTYPEKVEDIGRALSENDETQIKLALHSLRGSAQSMRFTEFGLQLANLEQNYIQISAEERQALYQKIKYEWDQLKKIIAEELSSKGA